jgi:hypothetical protein
MKKAPVTTISRGRENTTNLIAARRTAPRFNDLLCGLPGIVEFPMPKITVFRPVFESAAGY